MPAFDPHDADAAAFYAIVEPFLHSRPHLVNFDQLHYALDSLHYLLHSDRSGIRPPHLPSRSHVKCSMQDCQITSASPDACLINFASADTIPIWLCRDHHPTFESIPLPGWTPSATNRRERQRDSLAAWNKLSPSERPLLNRNIVTLAVGDSGT